MNQLHWGPSLQSKVQNINITDHGKKTQEQKALSIF